MNVIPLHEKIMVLPFASTEKTTGGIIIPDTMQERPSKATVVAVGSGTKDRPMSVSIGDTIGHIKNAGIPIEVDGVLHYILRDVDCHYRIPKE